MAREDVEVTKRVAVPWFPAGQLEQALAIWPTLLDGWGVSGYPEYCRAVDRHLRELALPEDSEVLLAAVDVKHFVKWCARAGLDSAAPDSRSAYAMDLATRGRVRSWPPPAGKGCWCGRDEAYELCCGV
jgi:hypothetical protein